MKVIQFHPLSDLFPLMPAAEMNELVADIKAHGLQSPIILYEGKILDGRHRYEACQIAETIPRFEQYKGNNPLTFVVSANVNRRHLTDSQRAMIGAKMVTMKQGERTDTIASKGSLEPSANLPKVSQEDAALAMGVSTRSITTAVKILDESPKLAKQATDGQISLHAAEKQLNERKAKGKPVLDDIGIQIPGDALPFWRRRQEIQDMLNQVSRLKCAVEKAKTEGDPMFGKVSNTLIADLTSAYTHLLEAKPYAVCTSCSGFVAAQPKGCAFCGNKGLISKWQWDTQAKKEVKDIRLKSAALKQ